MKLTAICRRRGLALGLLACGLVAGGAQALEFRSTVEAASVLYDAPSLKAKPIFVVGRDYPVEIVVSVEGWVKVRDASGTLAWIEKKALSERRMVVVRAASAEVQTAPEPTAPLAFRAEQNVLLELLEPPAAGSSYAKVRHRDGAIGFVRLTLVWGV